jgi:predicted nucleotidyltransferase
MPRKVPAHCYRCGRYWFPRRTHVRICARCKSPYFDTPKLRIPTYGSGLGIDDVIGGRRAAVLRLARKYGARNVRIFGSVARKEATERSDIDILVDPVRRRFDPVRLAIHLEDLLHRKVDVVSENSLYWLVQPQVIAEAVPL